MKRLIMICAINRAMVVRALARVCVRGRMVLALLLVVSLVNVLFTSTALSTIAFAPGSVLNGRTVKDNCSSWCLCTTFTYNIELAGLPDETEIQMVKDKSGWDDVFVGGGDGKIHVTQYDPLVCEGPLRGLEGHCYHGVDIDMWYEPGPLDPLPYDVWDGDILIEHWDYYWIQRFITWPAAPDGYCGWMDVPPENDIIDCDGDRPYYPVRWHDGNARLLDEPIWGCQEHGDDCSNLLGRCPDDCFWGADVFSYVAFGTTGGLDSGKVYIYEGVSWGFTAECVPEPATLALLGLGGLVLLRRRRK